MKGGVMPNQVKPDTRPQRKIYQFWLNGSNADIKPVMKQFNYWRNHRKLTGWILDMWRLWEDLSQGGTEVLLEMFPQFADKVHSNTELLDEVRGLRQDFKNIQIAPVQVQPVGLKPISGMKEIPMPVIDDEDLILVAKADPAAAGQSTSNFFASAGL
jgi:hypothetical protein